MPVSMGDLVVFFGYDDAKLRSGLTEAQGLTDNFSSNMASSFNVAIGNLMSQAVTKLASSVTAGLGEIKGFFDEGVASAIGLDAQLASIAAKMGKTKEDVLPLKDLISNLALDHGLVVNTTQAAEAIEMLAGNGASLDLIFGGLAKQTVALANATGNDFGLAAEVATSSMDLFKLGVDNLSAAFDGITGVTTATKFSLNDYKLALSNTGAVFAGMGGEIEDFNTVIAGTATSFASGADAGTSFKTFLQRLGEPTAEVKNLMQQYNISLFDAEGKMRPMVDVVGQLNKVFTESVTVTSSVGGATKAMVADADKAKEKIPELTHKLGEQKEQLQFLSNQLFETRKWYAEGSDEVLKAIDKYDDMQHNISKTEAELGKYNTALGAVANSHATTTTSTHMLTEAEKTHIATVLGGADGARMVLALSKMSGDAYNELSKEVNKAGLAFATAAVQVDSVQGAMDIFWGVIEAVQLQLGDALLPMIRQMTEVFTVFASVAAPVVVSGFQNIASSATSFMQMVIPSVETLNQAFKDGGVGGMITAFGTNLISLVIPVKGVSDSIDGAVKSFDALAGMLGLPTDAMSNLTKNAELNKTAMFNSMQGVSFLNEELIKNRAAIDSVLGAGASAYLASLVPAVREVYAAFEQGGIGAALTNLSNQLISASPQIKTAMLNWAVDFWAWVEPVITSTPTYIGNIISSIGNALVTGSSIFLDLVTSFLQIIPKAIESITPDAESSQKFGTQIAKSILSAFGMALQSGDAISTPLGEFFIALGNAALSASGALASVANNIVIGFIAVLKDRFGAINATEILGGLFQSLSNFVGSFTLDNLSSSLIELRENILSNKDAIDSIMGSGWAEWISGIFMALAVGVTKFRESGFSGVIDLIQDSLNKLDLSSITQFFDNLSQSITDNKSKIDEWLGTGWADSFVTISDSFGNMVNNIRQSGFGEFVTSVIGGIAGALGGGVLASLFTSLATTIAPLTPVIGTLVGGLSGLGTWFMSVGTALIPLLTYIGSGFTALYTAIASSSTVTTLATFASLALAPIVAQITAWGTTIAAYSSTFLAFGSWLASAFVSLPIIAPVFSVISTGITFLAGAIAPLMTFLTPVLGGLGSLGGILVALVNPITLVGVAIVGLGALWGSNFEQINSVATKVFEYLLPTWEKLKVGFDGFMQSLAPSMPALSQLFNTFTDAIPSMQIIAGVILGGVVVAIGALGDVLAAMLPALGGVINGLIVGLSGALSGAIQFIDGTVQMINGLLTEGWNSQAAQQGAMDVVMGIINGLSSLLSGVTTIGLSLIQGIAAGILAAIPYLGTELANMVNYIITTVKQWLGIASPSTVFAEIGTFLVEGLVHGLIGLGTALIDVWTTIEPILAEWSVKFWSWTQEVIANAPDQIGAIIEGISSFFADGGTVISEAWLEIWDYIAQTTSDVSSTIMEYIEPMIDDISTLVSDGIDLLSEVWGEGWDIISSLTSDAVDIVLEYVSSLVDEAATYISDISDNLSSVWGDGWETLSNITSSAIDSVLSYVQDLYDGAVDSISELSDTISEVWDSGWAMISDSADGVISYVTDLIDSFTGDNEGVIDVFMSSISSLWDSGWTTIFDLVDGILTDIYDIVDGFSSDANEIWETFTTDISEIWDTTWAYISEFVNNILSGINSEIGSVSGTIQEVWDYLSNTLSSIWSSLWANIGTIISNAGTTLSSVVGTLQTTLTTIWQTLSDLLNLAWNTAWTAILTIGETTWNTITTGVETLSSGLSTAWELMTSTVSRVWETAWSAIGEVYSTVSERIKGSISEFVSAIETQINTTSTIFSTTWDLIWDSGYKKVQSATLSILNEIKTWLKQAADTFGNAKDEWISAGMDMFEGIKKGILSKKQDLEDLLFAMAMSALRAAKRALGIESPSKEFDAVGVFVMEGWMGGIADNEDMVTNAVSSVGENMIATAIDSVGGLGEAMGGAVNNAFQGIFNNDFGAMLGGGTEQVIQNVEANMSAVVSRAKQNVLSVKDMRHTGQAKEMVEQSLKELNIEYGKMLQSGVDVDKALSAYNDAAQKIKESYKPVNDLRIEGEKNVDVEAMIAKAVESAQKTAEAQRGIGDVFDLSATATKERLQASFDAIIDTAKKGLDAEAKVFGTSTKKDREESLTRYGDIALKGVTDSVKTMVASTSEMLAQGLDPALAMKEYVEKTSQAFNLLNSDIMTQLPSAQAEGKAMLNEGYKDILAKLDTNFIGKTKASLSSAGKLFKQGIADGLDLTDLMRIFNESVAEVKATTDDAFIQTMPGTVARANELLDDEYRKMKEGLEKGLSSNIKDGLSKANQTFTDGMKKGIDPQQLMNEYTLSLDMLRRNITDDLSNTIPDAVDSASRTINDAYDKLAGSLQKDFLSKVKSDVGSTEDTLKKSLSNMSDPKLAVAAAANYLSAIQDIKDGFSTGLGAVLPDGIDDAQALIKANADKAAGELGKNFIKMVKDQYKDGQDAIKKGLENGIDPRELVNKFNAMNEDMKNSTRDMRLTLTKTFGIDLPKDFNDLDGLFSNEFDKVSEAINKSVTGDLKESLGKAEALVKNSFKDNIPLSQIISQYKVSAKDLRQTISDVPIGSLQAPMNKLVDDASNNVKELIAGQFNKNITGSIKESTSEFGKNLQLGLDPKKLLEDYKAQISQLSPALSEMSKFAPNAVTEATNNIDNNYEEIFGKLAKTAKNSLSEAKKAFKQGLSDGIDPVQLMANYKEVASGLETLFQDELGKKAPLAVKTATDELNDSLNDITGVLKKGLVDQVKDKIGDAGKTFKQGIKDGFDPAQLLVSYNESVDAANKLLVTDLAKTVPNAVSDAQTIIANSQRDMLKELGNDLVKDTKSSLKDTFDTLKDDLENGLTPATAFNKYKTSLALINANLASDLAQKVPDAVADATEAVNNNSESAYSVLSRNIVGTIKEKFGSINEAISEATKFGDSQDGLAVFNAKIGQVLDIANSDLVKNIPELNANVIETVYEARRKIMKGFGDKFYSELKTEISAQSETMKTAVSQGVDPATALNNFRNTMATFMGGLTDGMKGATPGLEQAANGLVETAMEQLAKLGGIAVPKGLSDVGKSLLGNVSTSLDAAKNQLKKTLDFGGDVNTALAQFKADMSGISGVITSEIGTKAPEALSQANSKLSSVNSDVMGQLASKYISQVKESINIASNVYKSDGSLENLTNSVLLEIAKIPKDVADAVPGALDEARQALATKISSITKAAPPALETLGADIVATTVNATNTVTKAVQDQIDAAKKAVGSIVTTAKENVSTSLDISKSVNVSTTATQSGNNEVTTTTPNLVNDLVNTVKDSLPDLETQSTNLLTSVSTIGDRLVDLISGEEGFLPKIETIITTATETINPIAFAYGKSINDNFIVGLNVNGIIEIISNETTGLLPVINSSIITFTETVTTSSISLGEAISNGISQGISENSVKIYTALDEVIGRVKINMDSVNSQLNAVENRNTALSQLGTMIQNSSTSNSTVNKNYSINISNPLRQPVETDITMALNLADR